MQTARPHRTAEDKSSLHQTRPELGPGNVSRIRRDTHTRPHKCLNQTYFEAVRINDREQNSPIHPSPHYTHNPHTHHPHYTHATHTHINHTKHTHPHTHRYWKEHDRDQKPTNVSFGGSHRNHCELGPKLQQRKLDRNNKSLPSEVKGILQDNPDTANPGNQDHFKHPTFDRFADEHNHKHPYSIRDTFAQTQPEQTHFHKIGHTLH